MKLAGFSENEITVMEKILNLFFDEWDSGGAVAVMQPVLMKLIAGKPISPLMGTDDEWVEVTSGVFQNKRCSSVFKDPRFYDGKLAYDIDNPNNPRGAITFPYQPEDFMVKIKMPIFEIETE